MVRCCSLTFWPCFKEERLVHGIAPKWDILVMVSISQSNHVLGSDAWYRTEYRGSASPTSWWPYQVPTWTALKERGGEGGFLPFSTKKGIWDFGLIQDIPYTMHRYVYTRGSTAYLPSSFLLLTDTWANDWCGGGRVDMICSKACIVQYVQYVSVHESYFLLQSSVSVMSIMVWMAWWLLSFSSRGGSS